MLELRRRKFGFKQLLRVKTMIFIGCSIFLIGRTQHTLRIDYIYRYYNPLFGTNRQINCSVTDHSGDSEVLLLLPGMLFLLQEGNSYPPLKQKVADVPAHLPAVQYVLDHRSDGLFGDHH